MIIREYTNKMIDFIDCYKPRLWSAEKPTKGIYFTLLFAPFIAVTPETRLAYRF